jgi:hypothetical protein
VNIGRVAGGRLLGAGVLAAFLAAPSAATEISPEPTAPRGLFHFGPFYLTPRFRIFSLGIDTNVFYSATERRTDFIAHGGPGLEIVVPIHGPLNLRADGSLGYLYYLRTPSQRRLTGGGLGRLAHDGMRLTMGGQYSYTRSFSRLGFEVDRRVAQEIRLAQADLRYKIGARFAIGGRATATRNDVDAGQEFFGADLRRNLTRDTYAAVADFSYALTPKTSFVVEGDHQADRFVLDDERNADSNRLGGGLVIASSTLLSGRVFAGARSIRLRNLPGADRIRPYADADLTYHFGHRTRVGAAYFRDVGFSAFAAVRGELPTLTTETYRVLIEKGLISHLDLRLHAGVTRLRTDGSVTIETPRDGRIEVRRNDRAREAGADLGYTFWNRWRIGLAVAYAERRSAIADLGVQGLIFGATVTFVPN